MVNNTSRELKRLLSIRQPREFEELKRRGSSLRAVSWMVIRYRANSQNRIRLGCTIPRYVGSAVVRNRLKRWCREFFREMQGAMSSQAGVDFNVVLYRREPDEFKRMKREEFRRHLTKAMEQYAKRHH